MADSKITDLATTTAVTSTDLLVMVDRDDTTMASTGTDKKVQAGQLAVSIQPFMTFSSGFIPTWRTSLAAGDLIASGGLNPSNLGFNNPTADRLYLALMYVPYTVSIDQITHGQAGGDTWRLGIYRPDGTRGLPSTLHLDAGAFSGGGSGDVSVSVSATLDAGWWWCGGIHSSSGAGSSVTLAVGNSYPISVTGSFVGNVNNYLTANQSYGALPSPCPAMTGASGTAAPQLVCRVA